jgi:cation:H+ antiporter
LRWLPYLIAIAVTVPWLAFVISGSHPSAVPTALLTGVAILGSAFLLGWACEVAEEDVPQALAVSVLALVAVLPEYAVDATFAWKAASDPDQAAYAVANMTGGNRLMLGLGWSMVCLLTYLRHREKEVALPRDVGAEITILMLATLYALVPVWRGSLNLVDTAVYVTLYVLYLVAAARGEEHESVQVGPAVVLAEQPVMLRRIGVIFLFLFAATAIFLSAEPFAEALVHTGTELGVDEFLLVQWVAPLASEAPEMVVAVLLVWRGASSKGLRTLVSSSVNQWTLLVGTLGLVYSIAKGEPSALPMDHRQQVEVLLTAAQCLFGIAIISDLKLQLWQGAVLLALFLVQPLLHDEHMYLAVGYLVLFVGILAADKGSREGIGQSIRTFIALITNKPRVPSEHH